jgi:uncharacterized repeat protein (TIGR01451 family)
MWTLLTRRAGRQPVLKRSGAAGILFASLVLATASAQVPAPSVVYGIDFSPYENGQDPNLSPQIPASQILSRMQIVAPYTKWVRSFSSTNGLENIPSVARQLGLKVAANAWISSNAAQNTVEIDNLIAAANSGQVDIAIVGSEAILRNDVTVSQLIAYMNQVRQAIPQNIPVTTADVYGTFLAQPALIAASDVVFANFYPYWEGTSINNAMCSLEREYQQLVAASGSKQVVISETGWPSAGNAVGAAVPSPANQNLFALQFFTWAGANNIPAFYFEAFDEAWKAAYEGPQGAHWGIFDVNGVIKSGMDAFFNGQTSVVACNGQIPGPVGISFTYVPPYGSSDELEVQVTGVQPASYAVATYIEVSGGWWTKPTFAQPTVTINTDGTVRIPIVTGGSDQLATGIAVFLIPSTVTPPQAQGGALPAIPSAVAAVQVSRTPSSISGTITDSLGNPIAGATISDPVLGSTTSAPDGKYSFYHITTSGTATLSVSYPNYSFPASPATVGISSGNQIVNFTGSPTVDLSVVSSASPNPVPAGSNVVETIVASNAGLASASDAVVTVPIPVSFTLVSASTTRGSCNTAALPVTCDVGGLAPTAYATVTVVTEPNAAGSFSLAAGVSGPDPDSNAANNSTSLPITVQALQSITFGPLSNVTLGVAPFTIGATASSGLTVGFASTTPAVCTVSGSTVTVVAAGTCWIAASQPGSAAYAAATTVGQSFQVAQLSQTITFGTLWNQAVGAAPFTVNATASSGLPVSFNSQTTAVCTVSGANVTLRSVGTCTIQATQAGDANYLAAAPVSRNFPVTQYSLCDISQDGSTNVVDVQLEINEALGVALAANDLNGDNVVNVVDVQIVINAALGLGCTTPSIAPPSVSLSATPNPVSYNTAPALTWFSTNATSCSASWTASAATAGSSPGSVQSGSVTYTMTCTGTAGSASAAVTVTVPPVGYTYTTVPVESTVEYRFYLGQQQFMTIVMDANNAIAIRPHPGLDVNGWGSSLYLEPFLPGATLQGTVVQSITPGSGGIDVAVSGVVSQGNSGSYGTWNGDFTFAYDPVQKEVSASGNYNISLAGELSSNTGDLNLYKLASNYLVNVPLLSGGTGNTGDISQVNVSGGPVSGFTWVPSQGSTYPQDNRNPISIEAVGNYNQVDTAAQGYAPIAAAYKPTIKIVLSSNETGFTLIFGGGYDSTESQEFWQDNVGITPLVLSSSTPTTYSFSVTFTSTAIAGDH